MFPSRLLLLNLKLAIKNMYKYALRRKVTLPGDDSDILNQDRNTPTIQSRLNQKIKII